MMSDWYYRLRSLLVFPAYAAPILCGISGLLVLAGIAVFWLEGDGIERDVQQRVEKALSYPGMERVDITADGRDLVLNGELSSRDDFYRAVELAAKTFGVRSVQSSAAVRPVRLAYLRLSRDREGQMKIEGELPSERQVEDLTTFLISSVSHSRFVNNLIVNPEVTAAPWYGIVPALIGEARWLDGIQFEIGAGRVAIGGLIKKQSDYSVFLGRIREFASRHDLVFVNRIGIISPDNM